MKILEIHGNVTRKLCIATSNKQKCHFFLLQNQRTREWKRSCLGGWYQWDGGRRGEMV
jgi:hypothetical protein